MNTIVSVLALGSLAFGSPYRREDVHALPVTKRGLTIQTNPGWTSLGCYSDVQSSRTLRYVGLQSDNVSGTVCQTECQRLGFAYAGTEYAGECFCDNAINTNAKPKPDECNMACKADATQPCGGPNRINVFWNGTTVEASNGTPRNKTLPTGWTLAGCYTDGVQARTLNSYILGPDSGMTIEYCVNGCAAKGLSYAGLEFAQECYCGNSIDNNATIADGCNMACQGDSAQTCGGSARLQLYSCPKPVVSSSAVPSSSSAAPVVSSAPPAVISSSAAPIVSSAPSAVISSSAAPADSSAPPAVVSSSAAPVVSSAPPAVISSSAAPTVSSAPPAVVSSSAAPVVSSAPPSVVSAVPSSSSAAPPAVSSAPPSYPRDDLTAAWTPLGCFERFDLKYMYVNRNMTPGICARVCTQRGWNIGAIAAGNTCTCGNKTEFLPKLKRTDMSMCNIGCATQPKYTCGGEEAQVVFQS